MRWSKTALILVVCLFAGCAAIQTPIYNSGLGATRLIADLRDKEVMVGQQSITYLERQGDGHAIIMLHGFASEKDAWSQFANQLPSGSRLLIPDLPGHGESEPLIDMPYTPDVFVGTIRSFKQKLEVEQFHLVGNSIGGLYALLYAARYPDDVLSLTLIDSAGIYPPIPSDLQRSLASGSNPLVVDEPQDFDLLMQFVFYKEPFMPWPARPVLRRKHVQRSELNHRIWRDIWSSRRDQRDTLAGITAPLLVIWGNEDRVLDVSTTEAIRHQRPDALIKILPECGHSPMLEKPELSASIFYAFISNL